MPPGSYWYSVSQGCALDNWWAVRLDALGRVGRLLAGVGTAVKLLWQRRRFTAVVLGGDASSHAFALLQSLLPSRPAPTVMIDCLWYLPKGRMRRWLKVIQLRLESRSVHRFVVWASHEVRDYARAFGIPEGKFAFIPFHVTLSGYEFSTSDGGYVFSGGNGDRDYATLVRALRGLEVPAVIATSNLASFGNEPIPPHVTVRSCGHAEFRQLMAGATLVVVPMAQGHLHSGGQQTYLNAMAMGKPVVVLDPRGAPDYVGDGREGFVLDHGDAAGLRSAIRRLRDDPDLAAAMGKAGRERVASGPYSTEACIARGGPVGSRGRPVGVCDAL